MVLVCHDPRFIFLKTMKTAGTSVEHLFQPFCLPDGHDGNVGAEPIISDRGIVGARKVDKDAPQSWWNHMPASVVARHIGTEAFSAAFKFATVRNPYRAVLSRFFFRKGVGYPESKAMFYLRRTQFRSWLRRRTNLKSLGNYYIVHVDDTFALDDFVRQESTAEDIARIAGRLDLPIEPGALTSQKRNTRGKSSFAPRDYFDAFGADIVQEAYQWCFEHCGYSRDIEVA